MLTEIKARPKVEAMPPPNAQQSPLLSSARKAVLSPTLLTSTRKHGLSPTMVNSGVHATPTAPEGRAKKRVRLSSPTQAPPQLTPPSRKSAEDPSAGSSGQELASDAWTYREPPPSKRHVVESMASYGLDTVEYPTPFYSNPLDVPARPKQFAGRVFHVKSNTVSDLPDFEPQLPTATPRPWLRTRRFEAATAKYGWEYGPPPPTRRAVIEFCAKEDAAERAALAASQLAAPTQKNKYGFKLSQRRTRREQQNMSVLLLEVFGECDVRLG